MPSLGRVLTAMATPMQPDRSIDFDGVQRLATHLVDRGNDGLVVCGTTGESPTLSHAETLDMFRAVVDAVGDRATVVAGCGKNDTAATVALTSEASALGVDAVMLVTPYYNKPSQRGLANHFTQAAAATQLPVMLYNIPSRSACEIAPETLLDLAETVPNITAVKDAVGDFTKTAWLAARKPGDFDIYSGDDATFLPLLAVGGIGVVSVAAHLVGDDIAQMVDAFPTDARKAQEIHLRLLPLFTGLFVDTSPGPLKAALRMVGLPAGPVRPPLADADERVEAVVRDALHAAGVSL
ncbi:MAG: 4-hydroxy-tetrahydrodipicolinate synthase [Nitriliruptorales bacterium]|nr:4-hydroxy-tetrahydrodipicolinate synthase [Nitriliruptorales bacterium]